ncbi:MAG: 5-bromo-4-chloroindolyl phosphate hydrolysis family protein [Beduini sp.]|uniref:5-bromo-4-chloroindolyl phosphate hydrolysis family protein n=1 Tax=Beduini sp. TaxID=1922300 RepID=UPI0039A09515
MGQMTIKNKIRSPYPFYGVGIFCLIYAFVFDLYRITDYFILTGLGIVVYVVLKSVFFHDVTTQKTVNSDSVENTLTLVEMEKEAATQLQALNELNQGIADEKISQDLNEIVSTIKQIFKYLREHPEDTTSIRKLLAYYLPVLIELLETYAHYETLSEPKGKVKDTAGEIEGAVEMMKQAIHHKYEELYQNQMIDTNAEIEVLKTMLHQDGLLLDEMKEERN